MERTPLAGTGSIAAASCDRLASQVGARDIAYFRQRAADATRLAYGAPEQRVAAVHESFARLYRERALQLEQASGSSSPCSANRAADLIHPDWTSTGVRQGAQIDADDPDRH